MLAWRELRRGASAAAVRSYIDGPDALDNGQLDTLDVLVSRDAWRMSELADALRVDPSTATRALQRLAALGLAQRSTAHADGRVVMVEATEAGRARRAQIDRRRARVMARLLGAFDAHERAQLASLMSRFIEELDAAVHEGAEQARKDRANLEQNGDS